MPFRKCSNLFGVKCNIDQMWLFPFALQRMGIGGADEDHIAFAQVRDLIVDPLADTSVYDPEKLIEIMCMKRLGALARRHGPRDQKGIAFG